MSGETVYSKAADIIREKGWAQAPSDEFVVDGVCVYIAIHDAQKRLGLMAQDEVRALDVLAAHIGARGICSVIKWNDAPERTVEDVLMVLKELHVQAGGA